MKSLNQFGKSVSIISTAALVSIASMTQIAIAKDQQYYEGTATLCAMSTNVIMPPDMKGNNGVSYKDDMTFVYLIKSEDSDLMNGWELMTNKWKQTKSGNAFNTGEVVLTPEVDGYDGTLEGRFNFRAEDANNISGRYKGTGDFTGVTADYNLGAPYLVPVEEGPDCSQALAVCTDCIPAAFPIDPTVPQFYYNQYDMSGWVNNFE